MPAADPFDYAEWYDLLDNIRTKVRYIYMYDHANLCNVGNNTHWTKII